MSESEPRLKAMPVEGQVTMGVIACLAASAAMWGTHQVVPHLWAMPGTVGLLDWTAFTLQHLGDDLHLHEAWLRLWRLGYQHYLALIAAIGAASWGLLFAPLTDRPLKPTMTAISLGGVLGLAGGVAATFLPSVTALHAVLALPAGVLFGAIAAATMVESRKPDPVIRGARVEKAARTASHSVVAKAIRSGRIAFAGTILKPEDETTHFVVIGASGSGKTTTLRPLIRTAIERGDPMVIADPDATFMKEFWRRGDVMLNPFAKWSVKWDFFADIRTETDHERMAAALLPISGGAESERWTMRGRSLLTTLMRQYRSLDVGGSDDFAAFLRTATPDLMVELVEGTESAPLFADGNERLRGSVIDELAPATRLLSLVARTKGRPFSIRQWAKAGKGRLWLPYKIGQLDALRAAIGCWLGVASTAVMSQPPSRERRVWFVADELDALGKVPSLEMGLTNGRRYGCCHVLGFQSISQLRGTYGEAVAATIEENVGTRLVLRCGGFGNDGTAEYASRLIGDRELVYEETTHNDGGAISTSMRRRIERAVLASEIASLPPLRGFLKTSSSPQWHEHGLRALDER